MAVAAALAALAALAGTLNNRDLLVAENIDCVGVFDVADTGLIPSDDRGAEPDKLTGEALLDEVKLFTVETSLLLATVPSPPFLFFLYFLLAGIYYIFILYNYA